MGLLTGDTIIDVLLIFVILTLLLFNYIIKTYSTFSRVGIYGKTPKFPFGNFEEVVYRSKTGLDFWTGIYNKLKAKCKKFGGYFIFVQPVLLVTDLDLIKNVLIKDFDYFHDRGLYCNEKDDPLTAHLVSLGGEKWKNLRAKLTPTFSSGKLKGMLEIFVKISEELVIRLADEADGRDVDIKSILGMYTTDVIGNSAFGIECNSLKNPDVPFYTNAQKIFNRTHWEHIKIQFARMFPKFFSVFKIRVIKKEQYEFYTDLVSSVIDHRKKNDVVRSDLMQLLIGLMNQPTNEALTFNEVLAQAFVFFTAGYDTSATATTFTLYELAENEDIQQKLREEVVEATKKHNGLNYDAIMDMPYLDKVLSESLRKYPPFPFTIRKCNKPYPIPNTSIQLPKEVQVLIPIFPIHRDPEHYPDPEVFDPERFSDEEKRKRHPCAFIPFGEGPRICIGMRFALLVAKVALAQLVSRYNFKASPKTELPMTFDEENLSLAARGKIWLVVSKI